MRKRTWTDHQFKEAVLNNISVASVLKTLGLKITGANYKTVKKYVQKFNLDTSHWMGQGYLKNKTHTWSTKKELSEILIENSDYTNTSSLKRRLIKEGLLIDKCSQCGITEWNNKKINVQLDHINGNNMDNRLENLRLLCPNCHSQTDTYSGKNCKINRIKKEITRCKYCQKPTSSSKYEKCSQCYRESLMKNKVL